MNHSRKIIAIGLLLCFQISDAQNQEKWLKRKWGDMIARYNIYFNATQKLDKGIADLASKQKDDFEEILSVYPYGTPEDAKQMRAPMEEVMKKASKVIQNRPYSKWADDAYFVIGKSHFFQGDYYAAIETFQFVNTAYEDSDLKALSQLWLLKSYMQQERYDESESLLGIVAKNKSKEKEFLTHLNLTGGDLLVQQGKYKGAIGYYRKGLKKLKDKTLRYRTNFILGQLYLETEQYKKASLYFEKVQKQNAPYDYVFNANLGMAKATAQLGGAGSQKTIKYLKRMLDDDKNIEYFDQIYYELAKLEFAAGNEKDGLKYMNMSAQNKSANASQQTKTFLFLANHYFNERNYPKAQAYYDSTVAVLPSDFPDASKISAKHSVLSKLIENIKTIETQDSLLKLAALDRDVLDKRISKIIDEEKERKEEEAELLKLEQERALLNPTRNTGGGPLTPQGGTWYFYNPAAVARGSNDFTRTWGNRSNTDWWRFVNKSVTEVAVPKDSDPDDPDANPDTYAANLDKDQQDALQDLDKTKLEYYKNIPFSATAKEVAHYKIQAAYMGIGKIYFDDLKEYKQSKGNLNSLLSKYSSTKHKPEAIFYLARCEQELGNTAAYDKYAKQIMDEYPNTTYNQVLNATEVVESSSDQEAAILYAEMYDAFNAEKFKKALSIKQQIDKEYPGNSIQPKVDYLYALIIGKTKGKEAYIKELTQLREIYGGNEIGEKADYTLRLLSGEEDSKNLPNANNYEMDKKAIHYYVITGITKEEEQIQRKIDDFNTKYFASKNLKLSTLQINGRQAFYMRQFTVFEDVTQYHEELEAAKEMLNKAGLTDINNYSISESNFRSLIKIGSESEYLTFFNTNYL